MYSQDKLEGAASKMIVNGRNSSNVMCFAEPAGFLPMRTMGQKAMTPAYKTENTLESTVSVVFIDDHRDCCLK